jgi:hypothetical protein
VRGVGEENQPVVARVGVGVLFGEVRAVYVRASTKKDGVTQPCKVCHQALHALQSSPRILVRHLGVSGISFVDDFFRCSIMSGLIVVSPAPSHID